MELYKKIEEVTNGELLSDVQFEYVMIADDNNSKKIWINRPFDIDGSSFKTRTILNNRNSDYYNILPSYDLPFQITLAKARQKMTLYVRCEEHEAEIIVLPYYNGHSFEKVIEIVDADKLLYVVDGKFPLNRVQQTIEDIKNNEPIKYEPKENDILGYISKERVGDNTLIEIINSGAVYIKQYNK